MIGRNDPCWCGSGVKFKHCHWGREAAHPIPLGQMLRGLRKEFQRKVCLHPEASATVCTKVIEAHTLQRASVLAAIIDERNQVLSFHPAVRSDDGQLKLHQIGWRQASTFNAFCAKHDDKTFAALEKQPFTGTIEQAFLLAYRAQCHELYQKAASYRTQPQALEQLDRGQTNEEQQKIQHSIKRFHAGLAKGLAEAERLKARMDKALLSQDYSEWRAAIIYFEGSLSLASTGAPTPTYDLDKRPLQVLHDPTSHIEPLYYATVATPKGGAIAFVWARDMYAPLRFVESLLARPNNDIPDLIVQFIFTHVENTYFSPDWWKALPQEAQAVVRRYASVVLPYYDQPVYSPVKLVNWDITHIEYL